MLHGTRCFMSVNCHNFNSKMRKLIKTNRCNKTLFIYNTYDEYKQFMICSSDSLKNTS